MVPIVLHVQGKPVFLSIGEQAVCVKARRVWTLQAHLRADVAGAFVSRSAPGRGPLPGAVAGGRGAVLR